MKKISLLIILISVISALSCNDSSSSTIATGYIDPVFTTLKTQALKEINFTDSSMSELRCSPASMSCGAVLFTGQLGDKYYTGIAMDNYKTASAKFSLKIYWEDTTIPAAIDNPAGYVVKAIVGTNTYSTPSGNLRATITQGTDANGITAYTITFTDTLTIDGILTITSGDTVTAYKYPE